MFVKVEFIVETSDFGEQEFQVEIEKLINDIDPVHTRLVSFDMNECDAATVMQIRKRINHCE